MTFLLLLGIVVLYCTVQHSIAILHFYFVHEHVSDVRCDMRRFVSCVIFVTTSDHTV